MAALRSKKKFENAGKMKNPFFVCIVNFMNRKELSERSYHQMEEKNLCLGQTRIFFGVHVFASSSSKRPKIAEPGGGEEVESEQAGEVLASLLLCYYASHKNTIKFGAYSSRFVKMFSLNIQFLKLAACGGGGGCDICHTKGTAVQTIL